MRRALPRGMHPARSCPSALPAGTPLPSGGLAGQGLLPVSPLCRPVSSLGRGLDSRVALSPGCAARAVTDLLLWAWLACDACGCAVDLGDRPAVSLTCAALPVLPWCARACCPCCLGLSGCFGGGASFACGFGCFSQLVASLPCRDGCFWALFGSALSLLVPCAAFPACCRWLWSPRLAFHRGLCFPACLAVLCPCLACVPDSLRAVSPCFLP